MKIILVFALFNLCNCDLQLPEKLFAAKDALEAEGNRAGVENLRKITGFNATSSVEGRVTGGNRATLGQFPYQALIFMRDLFGSYLCGGSLITYRTVLTAAHCIESFNYFDVYLGIVEQGSGATAAYGETNLQTKFTHFHEEYHSIYFWNDIGMIYFQSATSNVLNHICGCVGLVALPTSNDVSINLDGRNATVSGFGKTSDGGSASQFLNYANTPLLSNLICSSIFGPNNVRDSVLCSSGENAISSCSGDSGGPLTSEIEPGRRVQVGLVSFGAAESCQRGYPSGNTRITSFLSWIDLHKNNLVGPSTTPRISTTQKDTTTRRTTTTTRRTTTTTKKSNSSIVKFSRILAVILTFLIVFMK